MSDLLVIDQTPTLGSGRMLRAYGTTRALAQLGPLDVLHLVWGADEPSREFTEIPGVTFHPVRPSRGLARARTYATARARRVPDWFARGLSPDLAARARELAAAPDRGRVIADGPIVAENLRGLGDRVIYNAYNLESQLRTDIGDMGGATMERFERRLLARAKESWMVSEADLAGARALCPGAALRLMPNVVDAEAVTPLPLPDPAAGPRILFLATWGYPPNVEAGRFLLDEVLPLLRTRVPDATLVVGGGGAAKALGLDASSPPPGVELPGYVDDVADLYAVATCVVVPLLTGSGSPLKFVEAMAQQRTVVTTPRGAAGLDGQAGRDYVVADGAQALADALAAVLADGGAPAVARAGRELAVHSYSIGALARRIDAPAAG